jgi:DNA-directed RNA polymerase specialized sigma24 family protein
VLAAAGDDASADRREAIGRLCQGYWFPVYAFIRGRGYPPDEAADLTQEFFLRVLSGSLFSLADPGKGRFRSFLLGAVKHFLFDSNDRSSALKRGGGVTFLAFDFDSGESNYMRTPRHDETPERIFERNWAGAVIDNVTANLREEFVREGKQNQFDRLKVYLTGSPEAGYAEFAKQLSMSESAVKSSIYRLRQRFRDTLRAYIGGIVADPSDVDDEIRFLLLASRSATEKSQLPLAGPGADVAG